MADIKGITFNPVTDIPSLKGKVILITGANSGLGKQAALELAKHGPAMIYMAARSPDKGNEAVADIRSRVPGASVSFLELDLSSFASIKKAAKIMLDSSPRLDILMLNAGHGHQPHRPRPPPEAPDPPAPPDRGRRGAPARVVSLASSAWKYAGPEKIQFETLRDPLGGAVTPVNRYIQSKTANMLYARELAKHGCDAKDGNASFIILSPGDEQMANLQTQVAPKVVRPVSEGVKNQLWAATAPVGDVINGAHYELVGFHPEPSGLMLDAELGAKVWEWTQKELEGQAI
ncbi:hypothetical protein PG997_001453 [Apiospora hydei]|uniref:Uncharacterized protein n=1 Tax=Apiospora hydei TaxID=1337664 RepID=A0ABR1XDX8_9PEZI